MKVRSVCVGNFAGVADRAREIEARGDDGLYSVEVNCDPFLPLAIAAEHTERIELMTSIAVAFARNPMAMAQVGHDLNAQSGGRMILGLGSQIRPHITNRFSMPWSKPAARMREFVSAMRAIWSAWYEGERLDFRGEFYRHTLMTPMFVPPVLEYGPPRVMVAAVGPLMTRAAAEVADGVVAHGFTTRRYFEEVTLPAVDEGLAKAGRSREGFEMTAPAFVVSGVDEESLDSAKRGMRQQIAFYGSTPAYRPVLELHGWGEVGDELNRMSKRGQWVEMGDRISDEMLETFAIVGLADEIASKMKERWGGLLDCWLSTSELEDRDAHRELLRGIQAV